MIVSFRNHMGSKKKTNYLTINGITKQNDKAIVKKKSYYMHTSHISQNSNLAQYDHFIIRGMRRSVFIR